MLSYYLLAPVDSPIDRVIAFDFVVEHQLLGVVGGPLAALTSIPLLIALRNCLHPSYHLRSLPGTRPHPRRKSAPSLLS